MSSFIMVVVNLLPGLVYKWNVITGTFVQEDLDPVEVGFGTVCTFRRLPGVLERIPCG